MIRVVFSDASESTAEPVRGGDDRRVGLGFNDPQQERDAYHMVEDALKQYAGRPGC